MVVLDYALPFVVLMGILVAVHEAGHFSVARMLGIRVTDFAVGMGPEIVGFTDRRRCRWSIRLLPIGGYVKFHGDENAASANSKGEAAEKPEGMTDDEFAEYRRTAFHLRGPRDRALVLFAGPAANFLLGIGVLAAVYGFSGRQYTPPEILTVVEGSPAAVAGIQPGDRIISVDGMAVGRFEDAQARIASYPDRLLHFEIQRAGKMLPMDIHPAAFTMVTQFGTEMRVGRIGIQSVGSVKETVPLASAVGYGLQDTWFFTKTTAVTLGELVMGRRPISEVGGPVKIVQISGNAAKMGFAAFFFMLAVLSINLGVVNLLPFPILDGGHLVICAYEAVVRRKASPVVLDFAFKGAIVLLLTLVTVITWNDLSTIVKESWPQKVEAPAPASPSPTQTK